MRPTHSRAQDHNRYRGSALFGTAAALVLAACGAGAEADPRTAEEILIDSARRMAEVESLRFDLRLDGELAIPEMGGGTISIDGTRMTGAFDLANPRGTITFEMPTFLGMHGEMRLFESDMYMQMSMMGDAWYHVEIPGEELPGAPPDAEQAARDMAAFTQTEGVELERLDDAPCAPNADETAAPSDCHQIVVSVPTEVVAEQPGAPPELAQLPELIGDDVRFVLLVERDGGRWRGVRFNSDVGEDGQIDAVISMDGYGESVSVERPPEDEVEEGGPFFPFPSVEPSA